MFLVKDRRLGMDNYVFIATDPRSEGFKGEVIEGVALDYDMNQIHHWPDGAPRPVPQLGRDPKKLNHYKVFKFPQELQAAEFELISRGIPFVVFSWSDYRERYYPVPEEYAKAMTQDEWFDFLEEADFATKIRRKLIEMPDPKPGSSRDQVAEWVAKRHMAADGGIREVWYLPEAAPADEIRLLELSERYTTESIQIEPVDFGIDVSGAKFKLLVADLSEDQLQWIKADPSKLPSGWKLDGARPWRRR